MSIEGHRIGQYEIVRRLGVGGMAEVYVAERVGPSGFRRAVALKVLRPHLRDTPAVAARFTREARLAASLRHPNLVPVVDFGLEQGVAYLAMDLVEGSDLRAATRAGERLGRPLPAWLAVHVAIQVARGLAYAHAFAGDDGRPLGLVHRDVSPQNILLARTGEVRLADFGIAKAADEETASGAIQGKLAYLAPEQVAGGAPDARNDLFGLGIVLWELLAGRRLFLGASDAETLARVRRCDVPIPPPGAPVASVPPGIWAVLRRALAADPTERTPRAEDLAAALAAAWPETDRGEATVALAAWVGAVSVEPAAEARDAAPGTGPASPRTVAPAHTPTPTLVTEDLSPIPARQEPAARVRRALLLGVACLLGAIGLTVALRERAGLHEASVLPSATQAAAVATPIEPVRAPAEPVSAGPTPPPRSDAHLASPPPARPAARSATLLVTTRPSGAVIEVDGRPAGRTPRRLDGLAVGTPLVLVLRLDGHRRVERTLTPGPDGVTTLDVVLEPAFGVLSLDADPWAEVTLDGESAGTTPIFARRVPAGRRSLRLVHPPTGASVDLAIDVGADQHVRRRVVVGAPASPPAASP